MLTLFYIIAYVAILASIILVLGKIGEYLKSSPLHVRWELYPIPHEGKKAATGSSFMENTNWWEQERHVDHAGDLKALIKEVLTLNLTFEHNIKLWVRSYPLHLGLYLFMGSTILLIILALIRLFATTTDHWLFSFVYNVVNAISLLGMIGVIGGSIALIYRRLEDPGLRIYSTKEHFFNLGLLAAMAITGLLAWLFSAKPNFAELAGDFVYSLITFKMAPICGFFFTLHLLTILFFMVWLPLTQMRHVFMKYFTWHDIRWEDTPTRYSEDNRKKIGEALQLKTTWSAKHINPEGGSKTWVEVATTNPVEKN